MKIEVLVTTMQQCDFSVCKKMNIQTNAVIANQSDIDGYDELVSEKTHYRMITTNTRGLSRNRNIALAHCSQQTDIVVFSDDDLIFNDDYEEIIISEFQKHPEAQGIRFNIHNISQTRKISMPHIEKFERATMRNMSSSGVVGMAVKQNVIRDLNLKFDERFGAGTDNYCGEDVIFVMEMIKRNVKLYRSEIDIGAIDQSESSWFTGYDEKYFKTAGKILKVIFPHLAYFLAVRSAFRFSKRKECKMKFLNILRCYYEGIISL